MGIVEGGTEGIEREGKGRGSGRGIEEKMGGSALGIGDKTRDVQGRKSNPQNPPTGISEIQPDLQPTPASPPHFLYVHPDVHQPKRDNSNGPIKSLARTRSLLEDS